MEQQKGRKLIKEVLQEGEGECPAYGDEIELHYTAKVIGGEVFDSSVDRGTPFVFTLGDEMLFEKATNEIAQMKQGEKANFKCRAGYAFGQDYLPPSINYRDKIEFEVEILRISKPQPKKHEQPLETRLSEAVRLKLEGNELVRESQFQEALIRYLEALEYVGQSSGDKDLSEEQTTELNTLRLQLFSNTSLCYLKQSDHVNVLRYSDAGLQLDPYNLKLLYRRATARLEFDDFPGAIADVKTGLQINASNQELRALYKQIQEKRNEHRNSEKRVFQDKMAEDRFDGLFMTVVQQGQGIDSFLDSFFGFLRRRTDFYKDEQEGEKLIMNFLKKHNDLYKDDRRRDEERKRKEAARKQQEEEERAKRQAQTQEPKVVEITDEEETKVPQEEIKSPPKVEEITDETKEEGEDSDNEPGQIPVNNGGTADNYYWTQTLSEVNIMIKISNDVRGRDCQVAATVETLRVAVKGEVLIQGEFYKKIKPDDLVWTIDTVDGERVLQITFDKFEGMNWWKSAIKGHPEINTKKIQAEDSKLSDLDSETRQTVEKMMEDQKRKAMGLPTVEEEQKRDMLKKFMDAHPEMDFSKAKFS